MKITVEKPLVLNNDFRSDLSELVKKYGYSMLWVAGTEAELFEVTKKVETENYD